MQVYAFSCIGLLG